MSFRVISTPSLLVYLNRFSLSLKGNSFFGFVMASTRLRKSLYVIGTPQSEILGAKLPSNKQVLSKFLYHHTVEKKTLRESSKTTFIAVKSFWKKAGIPTRASQHCQSKIENLYTKWFNLKKNRDRKTDSRGEIEVFRLGLRQLFRYCACPRS